MRREENVRRLQVAVDQSLAVKRLDAGEHSERCGYCVAERQRTANQARRQRFPLQQLHREEQLARVFADLVELTDRRMVQARRRARLSNQAVARCGFVDRGADHFYCDRPSEALVARRIDDSHAPLAEGAGDFVMSDRLPHLCVSGQANSLSLLPALGQEWERLKSRRIFALKCSGHVTGASSHGAAARVRSWHVRL